MTGAVITRGQTFGATDQVTHTKLHNLVDLATIASLDQTNATAGVITASASQPTSTTGFAWFDTNMGAGYGALLVADNGGFEIAGEYALGYNGSGLDITRGMLIQYDSATASVDGRVAITKSQTPTANSVQQNRPIGAAYRTIANGATGPIISKGKVLLIKDAATVAAGDPVVVSITDKGYATTNALGSWGTPFGACAIGIWLEASSAASGTEVMAYLFGAQRASWVAFKNTAVALHSGGGYTVTADNAWQGTFTWSTSPIGTVAHILQVRVTSTTNTGAKALVVGARAINATVTLDTGAAVASGMYLDNSTSDGNGFRCQLIVPETTAASSNTFEIYIGTTDTIGNMTVQLYEVGVIVGGQVV